VFRNISHNPHLAKHVRELIYDATMFALGTDKVSYLTHLYHGSALIDCRNRSRMMRLVVTASTTSIPKIKKLIKSDEDLVQLHIGLQLMPDIKTVVLRIHDRGEYGSKPILGVAGHCHEIGIGQSKHRIQTFGNSHMPRLL
jgi:hypothetical protein